MVEYLYHCPVCDNVIADQIVVFCPNCHWELIFLPSTANEQLKTYYEKKLKLHRDMFQTLEENTKTIQSLNQNIGGLETMVSETKKLNNEIGALKEQLKEAAQDKAVAEEQLEIFRQQFGQAWINNQTQQKHVVIIKWETAGANLFRFYAPSLDDLLPDEIVILLNADHHPAGDGDFSLAQKIDTTSRRMINKTSCELSVKFPGLKSGNYFIRFTDLKHTEHIILFSHQDQGLSPVFDWEKTRINL